MDWRRLAGQVTTENLGKVNVTADMPGDIVNIHPGQIRNAQIIIREVLKELSKEKRADNKIVISIFGGSGSGKTGICAVLESYFKNLGVGAVKISGDNYPRRMPHYNDGERLQRFRYFGLQKLLEDGKYNREIAKKLLKLQKEEMDGDISLILKYPWLESYLKGGCEALEKYLGTEKEINFDEVSGILRQFKSSAPEIFVKKMGRELHEIWYEKIDCKETNVLILEWTHGNNERLSGVDFPIFLYSTPEETLADRVARGRDEGAELAFVQRVLEIEQVKLNRQANNAWRILDRNGNLLKEVPDYA